MNIRLSSFLLLASLTLALITGVEADEGPGPQVGLAGSYDTSDYARGVTVSGDYAYVGDGYGGLVVIDISDPTDPTRVGSFDTSGHAHGVVVSGN